MENDGMNRSTENIHNPPTPVTKTRSECWLDVERRRDEFERLPRPERTDAYNRVIAESGVEITSEHYGANPWQEYERLKAQLSPSLSSAEYEAACRDIARRCGV